MTGLLPLLSLVCVAALVGTVCVFVRRLGVLLRAAADSVRAIAGDTHGMLSDSAGISPSIDAMNQIAPRIARIVRAGIPPVHALRAVSRR